jgi:superfamily II DNA/RNA helicase
MQLQENIQTIISNLGIAELNQIQQDAFKTIQKEADTLLLAPTGSGKTLAFLLPIFTKLKTDEKRVQCLILTPSRELAIQIEQVWKKMSTGFKVNVCYGGHNVAVEVQNFSEPPALLVGTPGRIADHITRRSFDLSGIQTLVLDEFDKSLALGFHDQMSFIYQHLRKLKTKVLVSATAKIKIPEFTGISNPWVLNFTKDIEEEPRLQLRKVISESKDKIDGLFNLICNLGAAPTIIFCNHRDATERTSELLWEMGVENAFFHGGMDQLAREKTLIQFRNGSTNFLVASDLAARGLDIPAVKNVIHYHLPLKNEDFVHRNGRTARMNAEGSAYIVLHRNEHLPIYLNESPEEFVLTEDLSAPKMSDWTTLYISGGKKDKLSKGDIVGFLAKKGELGKDDIGLIEIMDFMSFVSVKKDKLKALLSLIQAEKMKGKKYKIEETALNG